MELNALEVTNVEKAIAEGIQVQLRDLSDLQLALVGGGSGDTIAY